MTDARAAGALFAAYFAYVGVTSPYLPLWLADRGLTVAQIGALMALPQFLRIVGPPAWGWAAHRLAGEATLLRAAATASTVAAALLAAAGGFWTLAALALLLNFSTSGINPITEAVALRAVAGDAGRYGRIRLWGSVGFVAAVAAAGPLLDAVGVAWLPACMAAALASLAAVAWRLPASGQPPRARASAGGVLRRLREPAVAAFFASCLAMQLAHAALYVFYSLYLERLGWSRGAIGAMWTLGVLAEIALFAGQRRLFERFAPPALLSACFLVTAGRFATIAVAGDRPGPWSVALLVLAQLLHAVSFGLHQSASMAMLHRWFGGPLQARAQAFYVVVSYGLGASIGGLIAARAWQAAGPAAAFWVASAMALAGWGAVAWCRRALRGTAAAGA